MDPLTHVLSGALIARATAPRQQRTGALSLRASMAAGAAAAIFPDVDFALRIFGTLEYLNWHQGLTHSLAMLPVWALLLAHLFARLSRGRYRWQSFLLPASLGLAIHIAGDAITAYGLMLLAPFSNVRYAVPVAFVIDPWITATIIAGLVAAALLPHGRTAALMALIALGGYVGVLEQLRDRAVGIGSNHARTQQLRDARVDALPQPLSPMHWKVIVSTDDTYHVAHVTLRDTDPRPWPWPAVASAYRPVADAEWHAIPRYGDDDATRALAQEAWQQPEFAAFRRFAAYPRMDGMDRIGDAVCVWFLDMRFTVPSLPPSFRFGSCRAADGQWHTERQRGAFWID